jgi:hypothetical protein
MNIEQSLKPCPLCGKPVQVALCGDYERQYFMVTRGKGKDGCKCRIFFESKSFDPELETDEDVKKIELEMIDNWNKRVK